MPFIRTRRAPGAVGVLALLTGALSAVPVVTASPALAGVSPAAPVVISEVYGGGGNAGSTFKQDFIELYNRSSSAVSLAGWSVQYASATGTNWATTALTGFIPAGRTYVVRQSQGAGGTTDVTGDATGTIAMGGTAGKVALVNATAALTCGTDCDGNAAVVDFVGYGTTANDFAGTGPTPAPSNASSVSRSASYAHTANNAADFTAGAPAPQTCGTDCTGELPPPPPPPPPAAEPRTIREIQGSGAGSTLAGSRVTTSGVVTASYPTGGLRGFYLQTPGTGGPTDPATRAGSDGLFVFVGTGAVPGSAVPGAHLQVTGTVAEFNGLTQVTTTEADVAALPPAAPVTATTTTTWPRTDAERESLEGMLYRPSGAYTVTNTFATNSFGEVGLASGTTPLLQPTEVARPGAAATAVATDNAARAVTLDDGSSVNYSARSGNGGPLVNGALTPPYLVGTPARVGAPVTFTADVVVDYRFNAWRFQPTTPVDGATGASAPATFGATRTTAPAAVGGDVRVASFNVLNYFTTLAEGRAGCTPSFPDRNGSPNTANCADVRGAHDAADLARQQAKEVRAINDLGADVVGLIELENSAKLGEPVDEAVATLVAALNADAGPGTWDYVRSSGDLPDPSLRDFITNSIIFKPARVTPVGAARALGDQSGTGQAFDNAREPIAQAFAPVTGGDPFLFVVNHFKSKSGPQSVSSVAGTPNADSGDGQGFFNGDRVRQAEALRDWIPTVLAGTQVKAVVLAGDLNAYSQEDPMQVLYSAGYASAEKAFAPGQYSYSFSGLSGSLDHVLLNEVAFGRATGADVWEINSPESVAFEYSRFNNHGTDLYAATPYRSSDHDPVVVGLGAQSAPVPVQLLATNDFHGRLVPNGAEAGAAVLSGAVKQLRAAQPNTVFAAAGDLIGASTFESFISKDKPTIDALNAAGLEVSAVGNHEFDSGYRDLVDRVMAPYDATTNPLGGAQWEYLGANVRQKVDGSPALPETWVQEFSGIRVGFVGAVTEDLPSLVSGAGIAELQVESIVTATNRSAAALKAAGADLVVLLVHEGAPTTAYASAVDPANAFGRIVNGVSPAVDAIVSGHTHLAYDHKVPVPAWQAEGRAVTVRPVVSAGQYGTFLNQLLFQVDPETEKVVGLATAVLPLVKTPAYPTDAAVKAIVDKAVADSAVLGARPLGRITGPFNRAVALADGSSPTVPAGTPIENRGGESTLGNLVAEVQRAQTGTQIAFMNPGGLRANLTAPAYPGDVTFRQAANVQPFANTLITMTMTGAQIKALLEQQWQPAGATRPFLKLGVSDGFSYTYDPSAAAGSRITRILLDGQPLSPTASYTVTANAFLASGTGDNFFAFGQATNKRDSGQVDLQTMVDYLAAKGTISPDYRQRSVGVRFPADAPASYYPGSEVAFALSSLAFTSPADRRDSTVTVSLAGTPLGTFPVDNTLGTALRDEYGTAAVRVRLPATLAPGAYDLVVTGDQTGTRALVAILVERAATTTVVTSSANPSVLGAPVTFTATVTGPASGGTVQFAVDGVPLGAPVALSGGTASVTTAALSAGSHAVTAVFSGDTSTLGSTGTLTQAVRYALVVVSPDSAGDAKAGSTVQLSFRLTDAAGTPIPDAEAAALVAGACRVTVSASGAQSLAPTCPRYQEGGLFRFGWKTSKDAGDVVVRFTIGYAGAPAQVVEVPLRLR